MSIIETIRANTCDSGSCGIGEQRRIGRDCASAQSRQSLPCLQTCGIELDESLDQDLVILGL